MAKVREFMADRGRLHGYSFDCPGCGSMHVLPTGTGRWSFTGGIDSPTVEPAVLMQRALPDGSRSTCHFSIRDGRVEFLPDSDHSLAGQTVDLPEV